MEKKLLSKRWADIEDDDCYEIPAGFETDPIGYLFQNVNDILKLPNNILLETFEGMTPKQKNGLLKQLPEDVAKALASLLPLPSSFGKSGTIQVLDGVKHWIDPHISSNNYTIRDNLDCIGLAWGPDNRIGGKLGTPYGYFFSTPGFIPSYEMNPTLKSGTIIVFESKGQQVKLGYDIHSAIVHTFLAERGEYLMCVELSTIFVKLWFNTQEIKLLKNDTDNIRKLLELNKFGFMDTVCKYWSVDDKGQKSEWRGNI